MAVAPTMIEDSARGNYDLASGAANNMGGFAPSDYNIPTAYGTPSVSTGGHATPSVGTGYQASTVDRYGGPPTIAQSMNAYLNPYTDNVIDNSVGRLRDSRSQAMEQVGGQANQAGAFGGSRHGLVERGVYEDYGRAENEMVNALYQDRFNTAAQLGAQDVGYGLQGSQLDQNAQIASGNFAQQNNALNMQGDIANAGFLAGANANDLNAQIASGQFVGQNNALSNNAHIANANFLQGNDANQLNAWANAGNLGSNLASLGWNTGRTATMDQMAAGDFTRNVAGEIIGQNKGDWANYQNHPFNMQQFFSSMFGNSPLLQQLTTNTNASGSSNATTTGTPSIADIVGSIVSGGAYGGMGGGTSGGNAAAVNPYPAPTANFHSGGYSGGGGYNAQPPMTYSPQTGGFVPNPVYGG